MAEVQRSEDLTLAPNEFALVLDRTNGVVHTYCGPSNTSLSAQEVPVLFDYTSKRFVPTDMQKAKQLKKLAPEGWYVILKNPAAKGDQPEEGKKARLPELLIGHKVNIPGPTSFALWPGQMAQVVQGHHLRQDEYLIARVYDGEAARRSFGLLTAPAEDASPAPSDSSLVPKDLTPGHLFIIKGTEASFYVPPTGIEVVRDEDDKARAGTAQRHRYVRSAVSLERLEYCLLRDQDGNKRYVRGPAVVFPKPTEAFVTRSDGTTRKFKAIELGVKNGIHVKVIADYKDEETGEVVKAGSELFIKGENTPIYFPREEHSIIKYGDSDVNFGVAIPPGEARYVMQRLEGDIRLVKGPTVFLPDPRSECIVRRILDPRLCALMYPGNNEALQINQALTAASRPNQPGLESFDSAAYPAGALVAGALESDVSRVMSVNNLYAPTATILPSEAESRFHGDVMNRQGQYRPPRTITIDSKYEGAVTMDVHEGYAVMLVTKRGNRRVIVGPQTALLEYDEVPHVLTLSTGKPKSMDRPYKTVYLQIANNFVTDIVEAETKDYCKVQLKLSYRLNFEGDSERWFAVENYVKLLCDNMRSIIRNRVRRVGIKDFYHEATDILRDLILGVANADNVAAKAQRPGRAFEANGMRIFDVEVLEVKLDKELQTLLEAQERSSMRQALDLEELERRAKFADASKSLQAQIIEASEAVKQKEEEARRSRLEDEAETKKRAQALAHAAQESANAVAQLVREGKRADSALQVESQQALDALRVALLKAETAATKERMAAITPDLVAALQAFGDQATLERLANAMSAQAFLKTVGGESIVDILTKTLQGSGLSERLPAALNGRVAAAAKQLST